MKEIRIFVAALFFLITIVPNLQAEPDLFGPKKEKPIIRKLYGTVSIWDGIGLSGSMLTRGNNLYTIRYLHEDRSTTGAPFWETSPKTHIDEIGVMYGKGINIWRFFLNGSAGLAYINYSTDIKPQPIASGGIIANLQASYAIKPWMAIGVEAFGDLNLFQSRTGFLINLSFGMVRG